MLEKIKTQIAQKYNLQESKGIFFSGFNSEGKIVISSGVIMTDKSLEKVTDMIYQGLIQPHKDIVKISCDIVDTIKQAESMQEVNSTDTNTYGICASTIDNSKSGVVLAGTQGIKNANQALGFIKEKNKLSGNINIYIFSSTRIYIS